MIIPYIKHFSPCYQIVFVNEQFLIGDGNNMYDVTYVENVAHAHICAERALSSEGTVAEEAAGQVFNI